ncbi:MAG: hypothetical protein V3T58_00315 [Candidatus Hydrothermarchaeales archaeon]
MLNIEETHEKESNRLKNEQAEWGDFYTKFKPRLNEFSNYEERIHELEEELENREKIVKINFEKEKDKFLSITGVYLLASLVFVWMIYRIHNPWLLFGAGVLVGIGFAFLLRFWLNVR